MMSNVEGLQTEVTFAGAFNTSLLNSRLEARKGSPWIDATHNTPLHRALKILRGYITPVSYCDYTIRIPNAVVGLDFLFRKQKVLGSGRGLEAVYTEVLSVFLCSP
jgi:hypothetical protein